MRGLRLARNELGEIERRNRVQGSSVKWAVGKRGTTGAMRARWCPLRRPQAGELGRAEQRNGLEARTEGLREP